jgi:hypothetical protein
MPMLLLKSKVCATYLFNLQNLVAVQNQDYDLLSVIFVKQQSVRHNTIY